MDEFRLARLRQHQSLQGVDRASTVLVPGTPRFLGQIFDGGHMPTACPAVFLTHPTSVNCPETEGAAPTYAVDSTVTIPVVVLGSRVPVVGDVLQAHAIAGRWVAESGTGSKCLNCTPCKIPKKDLTATCTHVVLGTGSAPFVFNSASNSWSANVTVGTPPFTAVAALSMSCARGHFLFSFSGGGIAGCIYPCSAIDHCLNLHDFTCDPFHIHFTFFNTVTGSNCLSQFTDIYIDDPGGPLTKCK